MGRERGENESVRTKNKKEKGCKQNNGWRRREEREKQEREGRRDRRQE